MLSQEPIRELLHRCASPGEEAGWDDFVERLGRRVVTGVRRALARCGMSADPVKVEEMVQEVYCRLLERDRKVLLRCQGRTEGQVAVYLNRVTASVVVDLVRAQRAAKRAGCLVDLDADEGEELKETTVDPALSPEQRVLLKEQKQRYLRSFRQIVMRRTSLRNARILELALLEGWSSREISQRMGLKPGSVDSLVYRMKRRLGEGGVPVPQR